MTVLWLNLIKIPGPVNTTPTIMTRTVLTCITRLQLPSSCMMIYPAMLSQLQKSDAFVRSMLAVTMKKVCGV